MLLELSYMDTHLAALPPALLATATLFYAHLACKANDARHAAARHAAAAASSPRSAVAAHKAVSRQASQGKRRKGGRKAKAKARARALPPPPLRILREGILEGGDALVFGGGEDGDGGAGRERGAALAALEAVLGAGWPRQDAWLPPPGCGERFPVHLEIVVAAAVAKMHASFGRIDGSGLGGLGHLEEVSGPCRANRYRRVVDTRRTRPDTRHSTRHAPSPP